MGEIDKQINDWLVGFVFELFENYFINERMFMKTFSINWMLMILVKINPITFSFHEYIISYVINNQ